jgi:pimeloyl-ACP methyl ester carboxylesterase
MKQKFYLGLDSKQFHRISYNEWGYPNKNPIICVHGLSRNNRDFDYLAQHLVKRNHYVVCPDVAGRGESDWLSNSDDYNYQVYLSDLAALIARLDTENVGFIGTSMGGILGMILASLNQTPIKYLVLNDIGPFIQIAALERIKKYVDAGSSMLFDNLSQAEKYFRDAMSSFGNLTDEQWKHLTLFGTRHLTNDKYSLKVDPAIQNVIKKEKLMDVNLWHVWKNIKCPVLVIRGSQSDVLLSQTVTMMQQVHPLCDAIEIPGVGHAPALMDDDQIEMIAKWIGKYSW